MAVSILAEVDASVDSMKVSEAAKWQDMEDDNGDAVLDSIYEEDGGETLMAFAAHSAHDRDDAEIYAGFVDFGRFCKGKFTEVEDALGGSGTMYVAHPGGQDLALGEALKAARAWKSLPIKEAPASMEVPDHAVHHEEDEFDCEEFVEYGASSTGSTIYWKQTEGDED
jgi:hypothetical protein